MKRSAMIGCFVSALLLVSVSGTPAHSNIKLTCVPQPELMSFITGTRFVVYPVDTPHLSPAAKLKLLSLGHGEISAFSATEDDPNVLANRILEIHIVNKCIGVDQFQFQLESLSQQFLRAHELTKDPLSKMDSADRSEEVYPYREIHPYIAIANFVFLETGFQPDDWPNIMRDHGARMLQCLEASAYAHGAQATRLVASKDACFRLQLATARSRFHRAIEIDGQALSAEQFEEALEHYLSFVSTLDTVQLGRFEPAVLFDLSQALLVSTKIVESPDLRRSQADIVNALNRIVVASSEDLNSEKDWISESFMSDIVLEQFFIAGNGRALEETSAATNTLDYYLLARQAEQWFQIDLTGLDPELAQSRAKRAHGLRNLMSKLGAN